MISVLNTWAGFGEKPLCIGNKSLIEDLKGHPDKSPKVQFMNFVGLRGSNAAECVTSAHMAPHSPDSLRDTSATFKLE